MIPIGSLRAKTLLSVLVPLVLVLVAVAIVAPYAYERVARDVVLQRDSQLAKVSAARVSAMLSDQAQILQALALEDDIRSMDVPRLVTALGDNLDKLRAFDAAVVVYDSQGVALWASPAVPKRRGAEFPIASEFSRMREMTNPAFSDVFTDPVSGEDTVLVAVPVLDDDGESQGVIAGLCTLTNSPLREIYADSLEYDTDQDGHAYLVDSTGRVIYHRDSGRLGADLSANDAVLHAIADEIGALLTKDDTGDAVVSGFAPVPNTGWALVTEESWQAIAGPIRGYTNLLLGLLAAAGISSGALVLFTTGRVLGPIRALTEGAQRIAGGDFDYTITAKTGDEVEALSQQFNAMAGALQDSYEELESRVADRTRELSTLNAISTVVSGSLDLQTILSDALHETLALMDIEAGGIYLLQGNSSRDGGVLKIAAHKGIEPELVDEIDNLKVGEGFSGRVVQTGQPLTVQDLSSDPRLTRSTVARSGFRTVTIVPLASREKVWGSLFVMSRGYRQFSEQDIHILSHIGEEIGGAIENARLFDAEQRRAEQFRVISEVSRHIASILDVDELLREIVRLLMESFGYHQVTVGLIEGDEVVFKAGAKAGRDDSRFVPPPTKLGGNGITAWVATTGQPLLAPDVAKEPRFLFLPDSSETRSELAVPMRTKEGVIGVLNVESDRLNAFDESDMAVLQSLANQAAIAVENARLYEDTRSRLGQVTALQETTGAVASTLELNKLLSLITQEATALLQAEGGILNLVDWERKQDEVVASTGSVAFAVGYRSPLEGSLSGWVSLHNRPVVSSQLQEDNRVDQSALSWTDERAKQPIRSAAVAPLSIKNQVVGTLMVVDKQGEGAQFDQTDLDLLAALANQAAIAIENARLFASEQRRAEQFRVLSEVGARITSLLEVDELLEETVHLVNEVLGYYLVSVGLVEGGELVIKAGAGPRWDEPGLSPPRIALGEGISGWVAQTGEPLLAPDVAQEPRYLLLDDSAETRSELAVPLIAKNEIIGVLDVQSDQLNAFQESDLLVLASLANLTAIAIQEARLFDAEQRRAEQFLVMSEVGARITSILTVDELLQEIVRLVKQTLGYYHTAIGLIEGDELIIKAGVGAHWDDPHFQPSRLKVGGKGITAWVATTGEPLRVPDVTQDERYIPLPDSAEISSEVAVPLKTTAGIIGVLDVQSDQLDAFDESDLVVLNSVARQAAIAIENASLYEQAQQAAALEERSRLARDLHDAVTQTLFSASLIGEVLPTLWESDEQEGRQLLKELRQLTRGALAEMRTLLLELRPAALAESSLDELLGQLGEAVTGRSGLPVSVITEGECRLPQEVHVALYRIAQEALNNVVKHANATQVSVLLRCSEPLEDAQHEHSETAELVVKDDGCGFDPDCIPADRLGLGIIHERAQAIGATLRIDTEPGQGATISLLWRSSP